MLSFLKHMFEPCDQFVCINCGWKAETLFKYYSSSVLKLSQCVNCHKPVDRYVEHDTTIIVIDIILQKLGAYRHVLYNSSFQSYWKLMLLNILSETYRKWNQMNNSAHSQLEVEWNFYLIFFISLFEWIFFVMLIFFLTYIAMHYSKNSVPSYFTYRNLFKGIILGGCGSLLNIPVSIWAQSQEDIFVTMLTLLLYGSYTQCFRAITGSTALVSYLVVFISYTIKMFWMSQILFYFMITSVWLNSM